METKGLEKYNIQQLQAGDGKTFPSEGNTVIVHYVGTVKHSIYFPLYFSSLIQEKSSIQADVKTKNLNLELGWVTSLKVGTRLL